MADSLRLCLQNMKPVMPEGDRGRRLFLVFLMIINLLLLIVFGVLVFQWRAKRLRALEPKETRICVPNWEFDNNACPENTDSVEKTCCGGATVLLQEMLSKELSVTFHKHYPSRLLSDADLKCDKVTRQVSSARLSGLDKRATDPVCHWQDYKLDHIAYQNGKLYIEKTGYYFLQSQVKMSPPEVAQAESSPTETNEKDRGASITYILYIRHFSYKKQMEDTILTMSEHHCRQPGRTFNATLSTGAVFWLERRDSVFVMTSHPEHIVPCRFDNRFALFLIKL